MSDDKVRLKAPLLLSYPCPIKWESMNGDNAVRNCAQCACKVQNISGYSETQVQDLLAQVDGGEQICVAFSVPKIVSALKPPTISRHIEATASDWLDSTASMSLQPALLSSHVTKFSIAMAASIGLAYFSPNVCLTASAQASKTADSNVLANFPERTPPEFIERAFGRMTDGVRLDDQEHGVWDGRPAPSAIRDYVNYILLYRGPKGTAETQRLFESFKQEVEKGRISVPKLEELGRAYELYGPEQQASNCYSLLSALADQGHARKETEHDWFPHRKPKVAAEEIAAFDQACATGEYIRALWHLAAANGLRKLDQTMRENWPWSEIATRVDLLQSKFACSDDPAFLSQALSLACDEQETPEWQLWLNSKRNLAAQLFKQNVSKSAKDIAKGHYNEALNLLECAIWAGSLDLEIVKRCNWLTASKLLIKLAPHLDVTLREECLGFARQATSEDKLPTEPHAHRLSHIQPPAGQSESRPQVNGDLNHPNQGTIKKIPTLPQGEPIPDNE